MQKIRFVFQVRGMRRLFFRWAAQQRRRSRGQGSRRGCGRRRKNMQFTFFVDFSGAYFTDDVLTCCTKEVELK